MKERVKEIPVRFMEFWNKYTSKQKTIIISVICAVLLLIAVVAYFVSRPTWTKFNEFSNLEDASAMVDALEENGIANKSSSDGLTIYVHDDQMTDAFYAMSDENLVDTGYTWDDAFDNSMSTTESEKSQKRILALQTEIKNSLVKYSFIKDAKVFIDVPETSYSVLDEEGDTSITAQIDVTEEGRDILTTEVAANLASWLAGAVGTDVEHVVINDTDGNSVYNGTAADGLGGALTGGSVEYCEKLRNNIAKNLIQIMVKSGYDDVEVGTQGIKFNMSEIEKLVKDYSLDEGRDRGYETNSYTYNQEGSSGVASGIPGVESNDNDETDYVLDTGTSSNSTVEIEKLEDILVDQTIENIKQELPAIEYEESSIGIVVTRYLVYDEEQMEKDGTLDGTTFEEFMAANNTRTMIQVADEELELVAAASGVDPDQITVVGYEVPKFIEKSSGVRSISDYLMIILAVLIIALLIFVVLRGTAPVKVSEEEAELSVEELLATTRDNQMLDDIEFSEKSETRKMIEKFVDEKPEAVAQLLRNWISEDWD